MAAADPATPALEIAGLLEGTPYRALHVLGAGGMGVVVAAEHVALGKPVVIKLLHARYAADAHLADRLRVEAQALARLSHENLVAVYDLGTTAAGRPYYAMERLWGRTLREEVRAHACETPEPPSSYAPRPLPSGLEPAILRAMAKRPEDRFASAAEFAQALAGVEQEVLACAGSLATTPFPRLRARGTVADHHAAGRRKNTAD